MASDNLDIPHVTVGVPDDNNPSTAVAFPCPSLDTPRSQPKRCSWRRSPSHTDNHGHLPHPTPTLRLAGNLDWAANSIVARDNTHEHTPTPNHGHCRKRLMERDANNNSSFRLSPLRSTSAPSPTHSTSSSDAGSRTLSVTRFFRRTAHRVTGRRSLSSLSGDTGSNTKRNDGQKGDNVDIQRKRVEFRTVLDNLEERLEAAKKLHGEALDLQTLYESGTVSTMRDFRATGIPRPLPQDNALFSEVDSVLAEIGRFYEELKKFWEGEIRHVVEALKEGRTDPRDFERWKNFHLRLKQTIGKNESLSGDAQPQRRDSMASSFTGVDLGAIALSLSSTICSLGDALERMSSSASLQYSQSGRPYFQQVYVAFAGNRDVCLSLLQHCSDYGEKVLSWCFPSIALPTSSQVGVPHVTGIQERTTVHPSDETGGSSKSLETLEGVGGIGALLCGIGSHPSDPTHGLSTGTGTPPTHHASPDPTLQSFTASHATDKDPPKPDIMIPPPHTAGGPQGLQSTVGLQSGSSVGLPDAFQSSECEYRTSIEDMERIFGQDIFPRRPRESSLHLSLTWPALKDKVLVLLSIYAIVSLAYGLF